MNIKKISKSILTKFPRFYSIFFSSFDSYQRFKFVANLLKKTKVKTILDVGGDIGHLRYFLPKKKIVTADISDKADIKIKKTKKYKLPFKDKEFDAVVTIDTFQYVKKEQRKDFIKELLRVSEQYVIITAPFFSKSVVEAEKECNTFYKKIFKKDNRWFAITLKHGIPKFNELKNSIKDYSYKVYSNGYLPRWKIMMKMNTILYSFLLPFGLLFNGFYNIFFYRFDNKKPSYRKIIFIKLRK